MRFAKNCLIFASIALGCASLSGAADAPAPIGRLVDLGGFRLHVHCTGQGKSMVVIENGLGDFSFDWLRVQTEVADFARVCTYDRAGYAWSDPGPKPRTFAQINFELRTALAKLGERGPFVLVGHSYGGPLVRNFAMTYPRDVAGIVLVDAAFEGQRVGIGDKKTMQLGEDPRGRAIPPIREHISGSDKPVIPVQLSESLANNPPQLDSFYKVLPAEDQKLQLWAQVQPNMYDAENSQREWSSEYFAKWLASSQTGSLGSLPLLVLTRAEGGHAEGQTDVPADRLERERMEGQAKLVQLSSNSKQIIVHSGHNMELEAPKEVVAAIRKMVEAVQNCGSIQD